MVALCDQWYIVYGEPQWQSQASACLSKMECYDKATRKGFETALSTLHEYAVCACLVPALTIYILEAATYSERRTSNP